MGKEIVEVNQQLNGFLLSLVLGVILGVFYDFFRIVRLCFTNGKIAIVIQDILFWTVSAFLSYILVFVINNGEYRWYFPLGEFVGFIIYYFTFGEFVIKISKAIVSVIRKIFSFIFKIIFFPFKKIYRIFSPKIIVLCKSAKNKLKISKKKYKNFLKKDDEMVYNEFVNN